MTKWAEEDKLKLKEMWADGATKEELLETFPDRTYQAIQSMCRHNKFKRGYRDEPFGETTLNPWYVTGLVDGEGYFSVMTNIGGRGGIGLKFGMKLRADDKELLDNIRNFFKCGKIYLGSNGSEILRDKHYRRNAKPAYQYEIFRKEDIENIVIPFFDNYPLQGKKQNDFLIWREIAELRKQQKTGTRNDEVHNKLLELINELREGRKFK